MSRGLDAAKKNTLMCFERLVSYCAECKGRSDTGPAPGQAPETPGIVPLPPSSRAEPQTQYCSLDLGLGSQFDYSLADARSLK